MSRNPPEDIRKQLRREVNFGCPIKGCRSPFLEYHHFNPKWNEGFIHKLTGMIALCPLHHRMADVDTWSVSDLNLLKHSAYNETASGEVQWNLSNTLFCIGDNYFWGNSFSIRLGDKTLLSVESNQEGYVLLNAELWSRTGNKCCLIINNDILPQNGYVADLECSASANHIKVKSIDLQSHLELHLIVKDIKDLTNIIPANVYDSVKIYCDKNKTRLIKLLQVKARVYSPIMDMNIQNKRVLLDFRKIGDQVACLNNTFWKECNLQIRFNKTKIPMFHIGAIPEN